MLPQQVTTKPALIEEVEKMNAVVVRGQRQGMETPGRDPYTMEVNREKNYYACRGFRYMAQHCKNRGQRSRVAKKRRLKYGERREGNYEQSDNLKEVENLESLN